MKNNSLILSMKLYLKKDYRNIDSEIILSIIKIMLSGNISLFTNDELEIIIKALCYNQISKYYTDYTVEVIDSKEFKELSRLDDTVALLKYKTIYLERETLQSLREGNLDIFRFMFHEIRHVEQRYLAHNNTISYRNYLTIMDQIIIIELGDEFYKENYRYFFDEVDARFYSECALYDFINSISPSLLPSVFDECIENILLCEKEAENITRIVNGKEYEKEALFDKIIKRKPSYVASYPLLSFYYDEVGNKIPISNILLRDKKQPREQTDLPLANQLKRLDKFIIQNRKGTKQNIEKDIESLINISIDDNLELQKEINSIMVVLYKRLTDSDFGNNINTAYDSILNKINVLRCKINI